MLSLVTLVVQGPVNPAVALALLGKGRDALLGVLAAGPGLGGLQ